MLNGTDERILVYSQVVFSTVIILHADYILTTMDDTSRSLRLADAGLALLFFLAGGIGIPVLLGVIFNVPLHMTLVLIAAILVFQPFAAGVGAGLSLPPAYIIAVMFCVALCVILGIFKICDGFAGRSARLAQFIAKIKGIADRSPFFKKYGIYMLVPFILVPGVGLYGCAILVWLFFHRSLSSIAVLMAGWMIFSVAILLPSLQIISMVV